VLGQISRTTIKQRDITGGLPRVQDLFEARVPKDKARISEIDGLVTIGGLKKTGRDIFVTPSNGLYAPIDGKIHLENIEEQNYVSIIPEAALFAPQDGKVSLSTEKKKTYITITKKAVQSDRIEVPKGCQPLVAEGATVKKGTPLCGITYAIATEQECIHAEGDPIKDGQPLAGHKYAIPSGKRIIVHQGDKVETGDALSDGPLDPHDMLVKGIIEAQMLILNEVQEIYRKQGVKIDDKHISVIIRQMFKKVRIIDPGQTSFLEGDVVDKVLVEKENRFAQQNGLNTAQFEQLLLGITKTSLLTDSWLSSSSFQETTKVLTKAAIEGRVDRLEGLKESIILGHRIPVGTGSKLYTQKIRQAVNDGKTVADIVQDIAHPAETDTVTDILDF